MRCFGYGITGTCGNVGRNGNIRVDRFFTLLRYGFGTGLTHYNWKNNHSSPAPAGQKEGEEMKRIIAGLAVLAMVSASSAFAEEWTITPKYFDVTPNDGIMDRGTWSNPYVLQPPPGSSFRPLTIRPRYFDVTPNDGIMDPGTSSNPWVIEK